MVSNILLTDLIGVLLNLQESLIGRNGTIKQLFAIDWISFLSGIYSEKF